MQPRGRLPCIPPANTYGTTRGGECAPPRSAARGVPVKIVISHVYSSHNNGDAAILSAQISELQRTFGNPQLNILTVDTVEAGYAFDGIPVCNALMYGMVSPANGKLKKLFLAFAMTAYTAVWAGVM